SLRIRASARNASMSSGWSAASGRSSLTATRSPVRVSRARQTVPIAPAAISASSSYRPSPTVCIAPISPNTSPTQKLGPRKVFVSGAPVGWHEPGRGSLPRLVVVDQRLEARGQGQLAAEEQTALFPEAWPAHFG